MGLSVKIAFGITSDTRGRRKRNTSNTIRHTRNTSRRNTRNGCENKKSERFGEERAEMDLKWVQRAESIIAEAREREEQGTRVLLRR